MITVESGPNLPVREATLFSFDDHTIPWKDNLRLTLLPVEKHPGNPVLRCGPKGAPDSTHAVIYGTVHRIEGRLRIWYLGMFEERWDPRTTGWWRPMCYAESDDGIHWTKPNLGLVEFNGNRENNICRIEPEGSPLARVDDFLSVLYEPEDPDRSRRYKAAYIAHIPQAELKGLRPWAPTHRIICAMVCATSADGLTWRVVGDRPSLDENFEVSSLYRFGNFYYATGQQMSPWAWMLDGSDCSRVMTIFRSPDLARWSRAKELAFARPGQWISPRVPGQQTHIGAGLWNRGNVLVGLYGMWQDGPAERPKGASHLHGTRIDLGLIVSNDGIHFREPVPDFKVVPRGREDEWDSIGLTQAHAFVNMGDRTCIWYAHWDCEGFKRSQEVGLGLLRRDGFGYLSRQHKDQFGYFVTCPIRVTGGKKSFPQLFVNVDGVSTANPLNVELLDTGDRPVPGFSGPDAAKVAASGTRQEVRWPKAGAALPGWPSFSVRIELPAEGDVRLYALYVTG